MTERKNHAKYIEKIQHFRLIDDIYFNNFMDDNDAGMELFLRIILNDPLLKVLDIQTQREISNLYGRSVRFDVFVRDANGVEYNLEIQRSDEGAVEERARFNSSMLDTTTIKKGFEWGKNHLPPARVIFITEHDVLHGGQPLYHVWRMVVELNNQLFDDKSEIIYVNAEIQDETALGWLMHDMFCENPDDMHYQVLADRSRYFKTNEHGVMKMCKAMEELVKEGFNQGVAKGVAQGVAETTWKFVRNLLKGHEMSYEKIAEAANTSVEEVMRIAKESGLAY